MSERRQQDWFFAPLAPLSFDLIAIDCPWDFRLYSDAGIHKSPAAHYELMADEDILGMPVGALARGDCLLLAWATWPRIDFALAAVRAWGFTFATIIVWHKQTINGRRRWVRDTGLGRCVSR